ncbi:MAG: radical SAM protein [Candidatus Omnitrophota bacterium]|nr:radical SAM protein [Candidatus Omnitrophota bacterium]
MINRTILQSLTEGNFKKDFIRKALLFKGLQQKQLFKLARDKRKEYFLSRVVEVRSVIEISNICRRKCNFCNINFHAKIPQRYTLKYTEIIKIIEYIYYKKNRRVVLLQSGENRSQAYIDFVAKCVRNIKRKFNDIIIILSLGNLARNQYTQLRDSGADRYILKFETSTPKLYKQIKPDDSLEERVRCIRQLSELGFEVGIGNIIGPPGQTIDDVVNDLFFMGNFKLTMASCSVFFPGENSNYQNKPVGDIDIALNYMALMRIMYPGMLIPSTSSLERVKKGGQYLGLAAGANAVTIHDGTPRELKKNFPIYSVKRFTPCEKFIKNIITKARLRFR